MAPSKAPTSWDDDTSSDCSDASAASPVAAPVARRSKFDDEEEDDDVLDDWEEEEDSDAEREKVRKAAEAKAKAEAEARAAHKSKSQRIEERIAEKQRRKQDAFDAEAAGEDEDPGEAARRARAAEKESDLQHAEDLFSGVGGVPSTRGARPVTAVVDDAAGAPGGSVVDLSALALFAPTSAAQFARLRETLVPLLTANAKKPQYAVMLPQLVKELCRDLSAEQVKKVAGVLNTLSNEKMKEEKAAEKGGKKTKAAKTKASLVANRDVSRAADTRVYDGDDGLDDDDFM